MTKLTCTEKTWDQVRPASVKKTGLGDAIAKALKVLPGDPDKLDSLAACDKALPVIEDLVAALKEACTAVSRAKDDDKAAAHQLNCWLKQAVKVLDELQVRRVEVIVEPVMKKWQGPREDLESRVKDIVARIRQADQNAGHAENMTQQAAMAMVQRASILKEQGESEGLEPEDYLFDREFKQSYDLWLDMVRLGKDSTHKLEVIVVQAKQLDTLIRTMSEALKEAQELAGDGLKLDSPDIRKFKTFNTDARHFINESTSDGAAKYASFRFIATPDVGSKHFEAVKKEDLARLFKRLTKVDADDYFEGELAKHGLNKRVMKKTLDSVRSAEQQVQKLAKAAQAGQEEAVKAVKAQAASLEQVLARLERALRNGEVQQALSKDVNVDRRKEILDGVAYVKDVLAAAQDAVAEHA